MTSQPRLKLSLRPVFLTFFIAPSAFAVTPGFKDDAWMYVLGFFAISGLIGFGQLLTALNGPRRGDRTAQEIVDELEKKEASEQK